MEIKQKIRVAAYLEIRAANCTQIQIQKRAEDPFLEVALGALVP